MGHDRPPEFLVVFNPCTCPSVSLTAVCTKAFQFRGSQPALWLAESDHGVLASSAGRSQHDT